MALSLDEGARRREVEFIISRWLLEHDWQSTQIQGLFVGVVITREDILTVVRAYLDARRAKRSPEHFDG